MYSAYHLVPEVIFYEERDACGYKIHSYSESGTNFLILASPAKYATAEDASIAAKDEIVRFCRNMERRALRLSYSTFVANTGSDDTA